MVEHLLSMREALQPIFSTSVVWSMPVTSECRRWRQENLKFKVVFSYKHRLGSAYATGDLVLSKHKNSGFYEWPAWECKMVATCVFEGQEGFQ